MKLNKILFAIAGLSLTIATACNNNKAAEENSDTVVVVEKNTTTTVTENTTTEPATTTTTTTEPSTSVTVGANGAAVQTKSTGVSVSRDSISFNKK
ncbi:hypothetical protein [Pedobacter alpinus]|uniref:Entericidin n=1 Tax=Pedobacter alpinus TaxID=1590643 RepID=A0ABW5TT47_9SPHI